MRNEVGRVGSSPLHVVENEQHAPVVGDGHEGVRDRGEDKASFLADRRPSARNPAVRHQLLGCRPLGCRPLGRWSIGRRRTRQLCYVEHLRQQRCQARVAARKRRREGTAVRDEVVGKGVGDGRVRVGAPPTHPGQYRNPLPGRDCHRFGQQP